MKTRLFTFLIAALVCANFLFAERVVSVKIGDLRYYLDKENKTAEVTYKKWLCYVEREGEEIVDYYDEFLILEEMENEINLIDTALRVANIPDSVIYNDTAYVVTKVSDRAFAKCHNLTSISIPKTVTQIRWSALDSCQVLTTITCLGITPPTLDSYVMEKDRRREITVLVPKQSLDAYKDSNEWKEFNILPYDEK